ncbi:kinase-like domain-containing protein, partial [Leptodontidium sp. 2 PMI_412]
MPRLVLNQVVKGRKGSYQAVKSLAQNIFQANVVGTHTSVVLKVAPDTPTLFINEANTYQYSCITRSPYIRSLREYINNDDSHCLVLEWMDNTLWETKEASTQAKSNVFKTVAKSCLEALAVFGDMDGTGQYVHADLNPNNILMSGFSSPTPVVKLADLGWTTRVGSKGDGETRLQSDAIRAPEIWKGENPSPACDIWSLGVSLAHWMSARIMFGIGGCNIKTNHPQEVTEAGWCIAKLHKIRGAKLEGPIEDRYVTEWAIADSLLSQSLVQTLTLSEELEQKKVPPECIAFIENLLVVD